MKNLNFDRRDGYDLILSDDDGSEYRISVTEHLFTEVQLAVQQQRGINKIQPARVQRLLREGRSCEEIADLTGFELADVQRFEPPIKAELQSLLERAMTVPVRTNSSQENTDERFGAVISQRLSDVDARNVAWRAYKTADKGAQIMLTFELTTDTKKEAVWSFNSLKLTLTPDNHDAKELSKQGDISEILIPRLRAVPETEPADTAEAAHDHEPAEQPRKTQHNNPYVGAAHQSTPPEFGSTGDLVADLRRIRSARENNLFTTDEQPGTQELSQAEPEWPQTSSVQASFSSAPTNEHASDAGTDSQDLDDYTIWEPGDFGGDVIRPDSAEQVAEQTQKADEPAAEPQPEPKKSQRSKKNARPEIPEWDEILFGTRGSKDEN